MKTIIYTSKRIIPTTDREKSVIKSWKSYWGDFGRFEKDGQSIYLIQGIWSGYKSSQRQIVHLDHVSKYSFSKADPYYLSTVEFSDQTTMELTILKVSREEILEQNLSRKLGCTELIQKVIKSNLTTYRI